MGNLSLNVANEIILSENHPYRFTSNLSSRFRIVEIDEAHTNFCRQMSRINKPINLSTLATGHQQGMKFLWNAPLGEQFRCHNDGQCGLCLSFRLKPLTLTIRICQPPCIVLHALRQFRIGKKTRLCHTCFRFIGLIGVVVKSLVNAAARTDCQIFNEQTIDCINEPEIADAVAP